MPHSSWSIDLLLIRDFTRCAVEDVVDDRVVLLGIARPMDVGAELGRVLLELFEVLVQVRERVFLDLRRQLAEVVPLGHAGDRLVAILAHPPDEAVVGGLVHFQGDEPRGPLFGIHGTVS